ncbi:hypothetical protein NHE_0172 [Neorickettsia helminthoeca str. Oregon]|uniref:Uncharacterized protein n=1 Tax=Neorickettsia helminthoeca str. Oregon TaxID=1286528 RepID=X5GVP7_9RICK|nr:hypothetical protein NHE_0172 [Neorickettsia helminthoeca str. Oregon]
MGAASELGVLDENVTQLQVKALHKLIGISQDAMQEYTLKVADFLSQHS